MSVVEEIKTRLDLVDLVSETVKLRKAGHNLVGFCPFHHNTRTPSFVVWPETQTWRCFGACAEGGDIFGYIMKRDGLDFREALALLAEKAGVELDSAPQPGSLESQATERLHQALRSAVNLYHHLLRQSPEGELARHYLEGRGLSAETIELFQLGYAPSGWDRLLTYLTGKGFTIEELVEAGLISQREEDGRTWDRFRHRLMIPIRDLRGNVIGFGARAFGDEQPKYLNSPQTALFDKSATLFALDLAHRAIREADRAVIVEGYMDVMQAHQAGFQNVVAQMGTALTETQLKLVTRYSKRLVLALDPDPAGLKATLRGLDVARETLDRDQKPVLDARGLVHFQGQLQVDIRAQTMPEGLDPDDLIRQAPERWAALIDNAPPLIEFVLQATTAGRDLADNRVKAEVAAVVLPLIQDIVDPVEQDGHIQRVARLLRVSERALRERIVAQAREKTRGGGPKAPVAPAPPPPLTPRQIPAKEMYLLGCLLRWPGLFAYANQLLSSASLPEISGEDFTTPECRAIFQSIRKELLSATAPVEGWRSRVDPSLQPVLDRALLVAPEALGVGGQPGDQKTVDDALDTVLRVRDQRLVARATELPFLLEETLSTEDSDMTELLKTEITRLAAQRSRLHNLMLSRSPTAQRQREDALHR